MVTISHLVKKYVNGMSFIHECLGKSLVNYGSVAKLLQPKIEEELGKEVRLSAVMMALRRHSEELTRRFESETIIRVFSQCSELNMKSGLCDISVLKSGSVFDKLKHVYSLIDYGNGDILNIIHGNFIVTIIVNDKHKGKIMEYLEGEKVTHIEDNVVQVSLRMPIEHLYTPGIFYMMTKELLWNNVNLIEIVSTPTELNFIAKNKDATRTYAALENLISRSREAMSKK